MVEQVTGYKTKCGKIYETQEEASLEETRKRDNYLHILLKEYISISNYECFREALNNGTISISSIKDLEEGIKFLSDSSQKFIEDEKLKLYGDSNE